jgi:trans-aconitate methyltransferase
MPYLHSLERTWESLAQDDPMWAICTDPDRAGGRWDVSQFMETGEIEINTVLGHIRELGVQIDFSQTALDFGCGVGRLTQALGRRFNKSVGVDISKTMVQTAEALNQQLQNCEFHLNRSSALQMFETETFGFVYSNIVLQHISPHYAERYVREFTRILQHGGVLAFQTADSIRGSLLARLSARTRVRTRLKALFSTASPMAMHFLPETRVRKLLSGLRIVEVTFTNACQSNYNGRLAFIEDEPTEGSVSKFYVVVKD